jgi:hypothetical protein
MARFAVAIEGDGLDEVRQVLNQADIPTIGPPYSKYAREHEPDEEVRVDRRMAAVVDAESEGAAETKVREKLPAGEFLCFARHWG